MATLYQKYRPTTLKEVIGQEHIKQTLVGALQKNNVAHAYIFIGPQGIGKTTIARILAKSINCEKRKKNGEPCQKCQPCTTITEQKTLEIIEIDAASNTGVDHIRELKDNIRIKPQQLSKKVYIIDEVHMLSQGAFNALLKTLEEPPEHAMFILATTEAHKIPATILSRCQRFDFTTIQPKELQERLEKIVKKEKIKITTEAIASVIAHTKGHVRDAESLLGQLQSQQSDKKITPETIDQILGAASEQSLDQLLDYIKQKDTAKALEHIQTMTTQGIDIKYTYNAFIEYLRTIMVATTIKGTEHSAFQFLTEAQQTAIQLHAKEWSTKDVMGMLKILLETKQFQATSPIPELPLEIAISIMIEGENTQPQQPANQQQQQQANQPKAEKQQRAEPPAPVILSINKSQTPPKKKKDDYINNLKPIEEEIELTLQEIKEKWNTVIEELKKENYPLGTCVENSVPHSIRGQILTLTTTFPFHKERINELTNKKRVDTILMSVYKKRLAINAVLKESIKQTDQQQLEEPQGKETTIVHDAIAILGGEAM